MHRETTELQHGRLDDHMSGGTEVAVDTTVDVVIPVEPEAAAALADPRKREAVGRIVSRMLRQPEGQDPLLDAMERLSADAKAGGLTPEILDTELAAHKAERRR